MSTSSPAQLFQHVALGVVRTFQRSQHLTVLGELGLILAQLLTGAGAFGFRLLQTLAQLVVEIVVGILHAGRVGIAEVRPTLHHFSERERLLFRLTLHALRLRVILLQLFMLLRIALQHRQQRLQLGQRHAVLLNMTRGVLRFFQLFAHLVDAVLQRFIVQQRHQRHQAVERGNTLFGLIVLLTLLLVLRFVIVQRAFDFATADVQAADLRFRVGVERHRQMSADKAAESWCERWVFCTSNDSVA